MHWRRGEGTLHARGDRPDRAGAQREPLRAPQWASAGTCCRRAPARKPALIQGDPAYDHNRIATRCTAGAFERSSPNDSPIMGAASAARAGSSNAQWPGCIVFAAWRFATSDAPASRSVAHPWLRPGMLVLPKTRRLISQRALRNPAALRRRRQPVDVGRLAGRMSHPCARKPPERVHAATRRRGDLLPHQLAGARNRVGGCRARNRSRLRTRLTLAVRRRQKGLCASGAEVRSSNIRAGTPRRRDRTTHAVGDCSPPRPGAPVGRHEPLRSTH